MTDPVRCSRDSSNHFTCEVRIDADLATPKPVAVDAPQPASAAPAPPVTPRPAEQNPAVSTLVSTFVSRTIVQAPPAPPISGAALKECASEELGLVLALLNKNKNKFVTALTLGKAALDTYMCLKEAQDQAATRNAENYCRDLGGVVTSVDADKVSCEVHERTK